MGLIGRGTKCRNFENRSMTTITVVLPLDSGTSVMKYMVMWGQGRYGVGRGMSLEA